MQIIEKEDVNTGHQTFIDIAKVIAILGMISNHFILMGHQNPDMAFPLFAIFELTGGVFAAPVFMFSMGIGLAYSRRSTPKYIAHRGIELTIKGWLLNIVRGVIPISILYLIFREPSFLNRIIYMATSIDILQFAGLAFLIFALFKKWNFSSKTMLWIAIIMALIGTFYREIPINSFWLKIPVGYFMGVDFDTNSFGTAFPLFHWFIFVAGGYYFGEFLKRCSNVDKLLARIFPFAFIIFISYFSYAITNRVGIYSTDEAMYYHMTIVDMVYAISAIFTMFGFCQFISKFLNEKVLNICGDISKNLNDIYIQQWIYISWSVIMFEAFFGVSLRLRYVFIGTIIVFVISSLLAHWFRTKKARS